MDFLILLIELIGTVAFAVSGAMVGVTRKMDVFGVMILGLTTAVGGGCIRDVLLGAVPPAMFRDPVYALVALATSVVIFLPAVRNWLLRREKLFDYVLLVADSLGLGVFTVMGIRAAKAAVASPGVFLLVFVGVMTGVGGGVLRDVLAGTTPFIFVKHIYACASAAGAILCVALWPYLGEFPAMLLGAAVIFVIRLLAAHYRWNMPRC